MNHPVLPKYRARERANAPACSNVLWLLIFGACLTLLSGAPRAQTDSADSLPDHLSLTEARRLAVQRNPTLDSARERVRAALAAVRRAESQRWPTLDLTASANRAEDIATAGVGRFVETPYETYSLKAQLDWLLFTGFRVRSEIAGAEAGAEAASLDLHDSHRLLSQAVGAAFHQALLARENVEVAERDASYNERLKKEAEKRKSAGTAGREDVLNFSVRAVQADNEAISARRDLRTARIALAEMLHLTPAVLPDRVSLAKPESKPEAAPDADAEVQFARSHRPDLEAARRQLEQAKTELTSARSDNYPQVRGFASAARTRTENSGAADGTGNDISMGIAVSWNAFDAGATNAEVEAAAARVAESRRTLAGLTTQISAEVRRQHEQLDAALKQLELAQKILDMTREIRDLVTRKYSVGQVTVTRLNQTQTDLVRAESQYAAAGIRARLAQQNLDAATGRLTLEQQP